MWTQPITPSEFIAFQLASSANGDEWAYSINPEFAIFSMSLDRFLAMKTCPTHRLHRSGEALTPIFQDRSATPITFSELLERPDLARELIFDPYRPDENNTILAYHCNGCDVWVVKDGCHRVTTWGHHKENREIDVVRVSSGDWSRARVDMPNFCTCGADTGT